MDCEMENLCFLLHKKVFLQNWLWINNSRIKLEFKENCLKQDKAPFTPNNVVDLYIVYELNTWSQDLNDEFILKNCLFGAVKLTKNANPSK